MTAPIRTLLVANRGEVARRVFRTCRELGIRTVAVYTPPDAGAPFVAEADAAVPLDGVRGYLDIDQVLAAAEATGADAVHPGWGFLAENAAFARACTAAGLTWVGPPPEAMESMGSKIEARRLMESAGVPVVPGATLAPPEAAAASGGGPGPTGASGAAAASGGGPGPTGASGAAAASGGGPGPTGAPGPAAASSQGPKPTGASGAAAASGGGPGPTGAPGPAAASSQGPKPTGASGAAATSGGGPGPTGAPGPAAASSQGPKPTGASGAASGPAGNSTEFQADSAAFSADNDPAPDPTGNSGRFPADSAGFRPENAATAGVYPSTEAGIAAAGAAVGFPLLVKASAGGGGKGMRLATRPEDLADAVADAAREAAAAFGDPAVFLERYVSPGRHVEVQVIGDHHGTVVHLFERDCSVQRRHQKLVEEAPSPAVDDDLRARMGQAAVAAAEAVGYHGVGTVEFLLGPDGSFYFLEMNTRLQVEHPVTELVTGLDLVRLQLAVAEGRPLPPEVHEARMSGHAVEVRLYAEDPLHDYQPQTGRVEALEFPALPGLRVDSGVETGSVVGSDYDSMLAKVIATGPTRAEAVRLLGGALRRARIHGVGTNRDLLVAVIDHDEFAAGKADTGFLDRHPPDELVAGSADPRTLKLHALAAALAIQAANRAATPVLRSLSSGFRNNPGPPLERRFTGGDTEVAVGYRLGRAPRFTFDGEAVAVTLLDARPDRVDLVVDGVRRRFDIRRYAQSIHVDSDLGSSMLRLVDRFPSREQQRPSGSLVAPMPGTVVKVLAAPGDTVAKGDPVVVIEAMKMEHTIGAAGDGTVAEIMVDVGRQVDIDQVIAVIQAGGDEAEEAGGSGDLAAAGGSGPGGGGESDGGPARRGGPGGGPSGGDGSRG